MFAIKAGAKLEGLRVEILIGVLIVQDILRSYGYDVIITEGTGGQHMTGSLHYKGLAVDIRSRNLNLSRTKANVISEAKLSLGDEYDFILEDEGQPNEHFHIQWKPKG